MTQAQAAASVPPPAHHRTKKPDVGFFTRAFDFWTPVFAYRDKVSLTKVLAIGFSTPIIRQLWLVHEISQMQFWFALMCMSAAFGEKCFKFLLEKVSLTETGTLAESASLVHESRETINKTVQEIDDRRKQADGAYEVTP